MMNHITSALMAQRNTLAIARSLAEGQPPYSLLLEVKLPFDSEHEPWRGEIATHKAELTSFLRWMNNHKNGKAGQYGMRGMIFTTAQARNGPLLKFASAQLVGNPKIRFDGTPALWPDWSMPLAQAMKNLFDFLSTHRTQLVLQIQ